MVNLHSVMRWSMMATLAVALGACAEVELMTTSAKRVGDVDTAGLGAYKVGKPYEVEGIWYYPAVDEDYDDAGIASWYGPDFHGKRTANGEVFDMNAMTAAHPTLPMPSLVLVTNLENGRAAKLRVNDRGPFAQKRIIDISKRGAEVLGFRNQGTAKVRVQILPEESRQLAYLASQQSGGGTMALANGGEGLGRSPIIVERMPAEAVSSESLAPPPGGRVANASMQVAMADSSTTMSDGRPILEALRPEVAMVVPVSPTNIYIQAGAFSRYDNANRAKAALSKVGTVKVSSVMVKGRDLYRVRIGPMRDVSQADVTLGRIIKAGYGDARIVVDK